MTPGVVSATVTALTQGVLRSMTRSTLATVTAAALGVLLCGLGGAIALCGPLPEQPPRGADARPAADPPPKPGNAKQKPTDAEKLQGIWTGAIAELGGQPWAETDKERGQVRVRIKGDTLTLRATVVLLPGAVAFGASPADTAFAFKLDEHKKPGWIDLPLPQADDDVKAIDALDGDTLTLCLNCPNKKCPTELKTKDAPARCSSSSSATRRRRGTRSRSRPNSSLNRNGRTTRHPREGERAIRRRTGGSRRRTGSARSGTRGIRRQRCVIPVA